MGDVIRPDFRTWRGHPPRRESPSNATRCVFGRAAGFEIILDFGSSSTDGVIGLLLKGLRSGLVQSIAAHPQTTQGMLNANANATAIYKALIFAATDRGRSQ